MTCSDCGKERPDDHFFTYFRLDQKKLRIDHRCKKCHSINRNHRIQGKIYFRMLKNQDNKCKICDINLLNLSIGQIHLDHNHKTGKLRGIVCASCNKKIQFYESGQIKDKRIAEYIQIYLQRCQ